MLKRGSPFPRRSAFWCSDEIAGLRILCIASLRAYQRAGRRGLPRNPVREEFKASRKNLCVSIPKVQKAAWRDLVGSVERDPWGRTYRIVTRKLGSSSSEAEAVGRERLIVDGLFPTVPPPGLNGAPALVRLGRRAGIFHQRRTDGDC